MCVLDRVGLTPLMTRGSGDRSLLVALLDGPVAKGHPDLTDARIVGFDGRHTGCAQTASPACEHGTFVAGMLVAARSSLAPAICPGCTLLVRPIFGESGDQEWMPQTTVAELAHAIIESVDAGARVLNVSASTVEPSVRADGALRAALDHAVHRGALVIAAAGNQSTLGSSAITRHPGVIAVAAYDAAGWPITATNLGSSIGRRGLGAVGEQVESLRALGGTLKLTGTSFAAPFVTGAIALLWSAFPGADAAQVRHAVTGIGPRTTVVPPLLDAWAAYATLAASIRRTVMSA